MDPAVAHNYLNEFYDLPVAANWTITVVGAGSAVAQADGAGGLITFTTDTGANDAVQIQKIGAAFKLTTAKPLFFEAKFKLSDALKTKIAIGLCLTDTTVIAAVDDGVFFDKSATTGVMAFNTEKDTSKTSAASVGTIVTDTLIKVGFYFDGAGKVQYFVDGVYKGVAALTIPDDEFLTPTLALMNGEGVSKVMTIDYLKCFQIR
jgi:hypothetical protein